MTKKLYEETNISDIASAIREKNGSNNQYTVAQMAGAVRAITTQPNLEELSASENGTYTPSSGKDGFSRAVVNVQPKLEELNASANGSYTPSSGKDGFSRVNVNVSSGGGSAILVQKTITTNGTFNALLDDEADGYSEVVVAVPSGGSGIVLSGTADPTSDIGNNEDLYIKYAIYSLEQYTHSYSILGTYRKNNNVWENYTEVYPKNSVHIQTVSTSGSRAVISYDTGNGPVEMDHTYAQNRTITIAMNDADMMSLTYISPNWTLKAIAPCTVNGTRYTQGETILSWRYTDVVDFYVALA